MEENSEFNFNMLSRKQLLKLANAYNVKINGGLANPKTSDDELHDAINEQLSVLPDGSIERKDKSTPHNEIKIQGGARVRIIIL
jgi:hypothetical protein